MVYLIFAFILWFLGVYLESFWSFGGLIGASGLSFGVALVSNRAQNWNEIK